jgi:hypothetical protein
VSSAEARVSLDAADIPTSPVELVEEGPNHYSGTVTFPVAGEWSLDVIVEATEGEAVRLSATVVIP